MTADQRYENDNQFRMLVDWMEKFIHDTQFTPSELREAAMLAAIHYEMRRPWPQMSFGAPADGGKE